MVMFWLPYILMAWYDYAYECERMQPTIVPFGRYLFLPFKPPDYKTEYENLPRDNKVAMQQLDHVVTWTLLIIGVAFYVKYKGQYK